MNPLKGKKQSPEHIAKRVATRKFNDNYKLSEISIEKIKIARAKQVITEATKIKLSISQKRIGNRPPVLFGEDHPAWKGEKVSYRSLHSWVERRLGKPKQCANCGTTVSKRFSWANVSHEYRRDLSDWVRLCGVCHIKYDRKHVPLKKK